MKDVITGSSKHEDISFALTSAIEDVAILSVMYIEYDILDSKKEQCKELLKKSEEELSEIGIERSEIEIKLKAYEELVEYAWLGVEKFSLKEKIKECREIIEKRLGEINEVEIKKKVYEELLSKNK